MKADHLLHGRFAPFSRKLSAPETTALEVTRQLTLRSSVLCVAAGLVVCPSVAKAQSFGLPSGAECGMGYAASSGWDLNQRNLRFSETCNGTWTLKDMGSARVGVSRAPGFRTAHVTDVEYGHWYHQVANGTGGIASDKFILPAGTACGFTETCGGNTPDDVAYADASNVTCMGHNAASGCPAGWTRKTAANMRARSGCNFAWCEYQDPNNYCSTHDCGAVLPEGILCGITDSRKSPASGGGSCMGVATNTGTCPAGFRFRGPYDDGSPANTGVGFCVKAQPKYSYCAGENGSCVFAGTSNVRYGANGSYAYGTFTNGVSCSNAVFGDPAPNVVKQCYFGPSDVGTTYCADEGQNCNAGRGKTAIYGANQQFIYKQVSGTFACTNAFFGSDPIPGVVKACYLVTAGTPNDPVPPPTSGSITVYYEVATSSSCSLAAMVIDNNHTFDITNIPGTHWMVSENGLPANGIGWCYYNSGFSAVNPGAHQVCACAPPYIGADPVCSCTNVTVVSGQTAVARISQ